MCTVVYVSQFHSSTRHSAIVDSMLDHRLRRWPNFEPTMAECLMFAGLALELPGEV